jgi:hypothetical protein
MSKSKDEWKKGLGWNIGMGSYSSLICGCTSTFIYFDHLGDDTP